MRRASEWNQPCPEKNCAHYGQINQGNVISISTYMTQSEKRHIFRCNTGSTPFLWRVLSRSFLSVFTPTLHCQNHKIARLGCSQYLKPAFFKISSKIIPGSPFAFN